MSKRILIQSSQRTTGTPGDFRIGFPTGISLEGKYKLAELYMCNSAYNVTATNNTLYWNESGGDMNTTVPSGYYTATTLANAIGTALTNATGTGSTFTGSYSSTTGKITFTSTPSASITWQFDVYSTNSIAALIGFSNESGTSTTGTNLANVSPLLNYRIMINSITAGEDIKGVGYTYLVPAQGNLGDYFIWHPHPSYLQEVYISRTTNVRIQVVNDSGITIALLAEWYFVLETC